MQEGMCYSCGLMRLTAKNLRFVLGVVGGLDPATAATRAGFSDGRRAAERLMADPDVVDEIERRRARSVPSPAVTQRRQSARTETAGPPPPLEGVVVQPGDAGFSRFWIRDRLMRTVRIALGEEPRIVTKILTATKENGEPVIQAVQIATHDTDLMAATRALDQLSREADRLEARGALAPDEDEARMRESLAEARGPLNAVGADRLRGDTLDALREAIREATAQ